MNGSRSRLIPARLAVFGFCLCFGLPSTGALAEEGMLELNVRHRIETAPDSGRYHAVVRPARWNPKKTCIVVCDMWDQHWCHGATRRVAEMAPRMNEVIKAARKQGVLIIHCPSNCMDQYQDTPQRKLAQNAPQVKTEVPLQNWCYLDESRESKMPVDASDHGCDDCGGAECKPRRAWTRQIDAIEIAAGDAITDSAEAFYLMKQRGVSNVIVMGVHTNMCVLGRPFSIRQMVYQGQNVVLMRDMTDTMYNPERPPYVSHFSGTDLVVEHIEKYWCPTITSADFLGGGAFRFKNDKRPHVAVVMAEDEYGTPETLTAFADSELRRDFRVSLIYADAEDRNDLPGIEILRDADLAIFSIRRRVLPEKQMEIIRRFIEAGKPLVAIRTSSHAFALRKGKPPAGHADWPEFDREILGGHYNFHHGNSGDNERTRVWAVDGAGKHPVMRGVPTEEFPVRAWLYRHQPLTDSTTLLMMGRFGDRKPHEPVTWVNQTKFGGRVFYTMMGHREEFAMPAFGRLLVNAVYWAAGLDVPEEPPQSVARRENSEGGSKSEKEDSPAGKADKKADSKQEAGDSSADKEKSADAAGEAMEPTRGEQVEVPPGGPPVKLSAAELTPDWVSLKVPGLWDDAEGKRFARYDGFAWYRCGVGLPSSWAKKDLSLFVEKLDNAHECYVNGTQVGGAGSLPPEYESGLTLAKRYRLPAELLKADGTNLIAIRVYDHDGRGGFKGLAPALFNERMVIDLTGPWQFRLGDDANWAKLGEGESLAEKFVYTKIDKAANITPRWVTELKETGGLSPAESAEKFDVHEDFTLRQVLHEPAVRQPLQISFDERGRLWLVQYLQYPHPAGLTMVSRDNYWRAVYDKVPPAPPNHFRGKDKITIHEDTDGDGVYDKHKVFVEGLNIATSCARGRGGVWVLNPPYLLFYPDENNDDVPDGDPVVHLEGFGLEDTHSVTNSLRWGPDGWLYAAQGSTVSAAVKRPGIDKKPIATTMGQLIWRYHPETRRYEIFAEGGGNAFGIALDAKGRLYSGHNGGNTRGFHYVQGGYYRKGFSKHGPLSNPYAFGYFDPMAHHDVPRFTHTFAVYESGLPDPYQGKLFGVEPLQSQIVLADMDRNGSTFGTKDRFRPVRSEDKWFRPVDIKQGPDGALYIADWYDGQVNHYRNHEGRIDPTSGRIYRLATKVPGHELPQNYAELSSAELVDLLGHPGKWHRQTALRLLGDRKDASVVPRLKKILAGEEGQLALEALWAVNLCGGLDEALAHETLKHADPHVRKWTVRLLGDTREVSEPIAGKLAGMAEEEPHVEVRSQLACSARRLPAEQGLPILRALLAHKQDLADAHVPLLIWWALESYCDEDRDRVLSLLADSETWSLPMVREHILERLMRRFAMAGTRRDLLTCAKLLELAPNRLAAEKLLAGFEKAYEGRSLAGSPDELIDALAAVGGGSLALRLRRGDAAAVEKALGAIADEKAPAAKRREYVEILGEVKQPEAVPVLLEVLARTSHAPLQQAILTALQSYDRSEIAEQVIALHDRFGPDSRTVAQSLLASRRSWARRLLEAVDAGKMEPESISMPIVRKMLLHGDEATQSLIRKHWANLGGATTERMQAEIERLTGVILSGYGSPYKGKLLFKENCAKCHTLFGEGGNVGPDLTTYKRDDVAGMLLNVVNPSAEIREGFENYMILTEDGRALSGFIADQDNRVIVLKGVDGQGIRLPRDEIDVLKPIGRSVMPEGALKPLSDQQIRDLFAYLRSTQPLNN